MIYSILQKEPESLIKNARPDCAPSWSTSSVQALTKKAADRYRTMEEFREDLVGCRRRPQAAQGQGPA